jgi:hypothetical protein
MAFTVILVGQEIVGSTLSETVTVKLHVAVCPLLAVTIKVLIVTPIGKDDPDDRPET